MHFWKSAKYLFLNFLNDLENSAWNRLSMENVEFQQRNDQERMSQYHGYETL